MTENIAFSMRRGGSVTRSEHVRPRTAPRPRRGHRQRSPAASVALHATVGVATGLALFPIAFILLVSLRGEDGWTHPTALGGFTVCNCIHLLGGTGVLVWFANRTLVDGGATQGGVRSSARRGD